MMYERYPQIKFDTTCTCPEIVISSERKATVAKHGSQMGAYSLHGAKSGRPVSMKYFTFCPLSRSE